MDIIVAVASWGYFGLWLASFLSLILAEGVSVNYRATVAISILPLIILVGRCLHWW